MFVLRSAVHKSFDYALWVDVGSAPPGGHAASAPCRAGPTTRIAYCAEPSQPKQALCYLPDGPIWSLSCRAFSCLGAALPKAPLWERTART